MSLAVVDRCLVQRGLLAQVKGLGCSCLRTQFLRGCCVLFISFCEICRTCYKPSLHAAMLHTCDGAFQTSCDVSKSHAMCCDRKFNMLNILVPTLVYLSYLSSDFQTGFSIVMDIYCTFM